MPSEHLIVTEQTALAVCQVYEQRRDPPTSWVREMHKALTAAAVDVTPALQQKEAQ